MIPDSVPSFDAEVGPTAPYAVVAPVVQVLGPMTARLEATFVGPTGTSVIGRAWISDADGTLVDGQTGEIRAGTRTAIELTIPEPRPRNGDLIACIRIEWPEFRTKHVVRATLAEGEIVHPPRGGECE